MRAVIFANGDFVPPADLAARLAAADLVIAADGGANHCRALSIVPDVVIGDLDSLDHTIGEQLEAQGAQIISHPTDKDETDLELALAHAQAAGAQEVVVLGSLGGRWDHSLANLFLAAQATFGGLNILFLHGEQRVFVIHGQAELDARPSERVSLLPLMGDAVSVKTEGLRFPLDKETLPFGTSRGVSNVVSSVPVRVSLQSGALLCVISPVTD